MTLILIYNDKTETIDFTVALDEYCCIFDEICKIVVETFNLNNLLDNYNMVYYDVEYNLWINFNIHVTKRIIQIIRHSTSRTLKIRVEQPRRNLFTSIMKKNIVNKVESKLNDDGKCAHLIIWLDEHIGNPLWHKQLKQDCRAMINTHINFIKADNIDTLIQYNTCKHIDLTWKTNSKYSFETTNNYSCPFQCVLFTVDNTDMFFGYLNMSLEFTRSLSLIISEKFAREILPIVLSRQQKQMLPDVLFLYVLCWDILDYSEWAVGYLYNDKFSFPKHLEVFNDEEALFVRLLNDVCGHLTSEANKRRHQKENWHALQYYSAAKQLFLNSFCWDPCYSLREVDRLDQLIKDLEREATESFLKKFSFYIDNKYKQPDDKISQECAEILE